MTTTRSTIGRHAVIARSEHFASLDSLEGVEPVVVARGVSRFRRLRPFVAAYPGITVAATIALAATFLSQHYGAPVMLFALLLGMAFHFLHREGACVVGIEFCARTVLRVGVGLLGVRITGGEIVSLGIGPIATILVAVATTILLGAWLARRLRLERLLGILSGGAVAICGASAALAIASVLPSYKDKERDTILVVVSVTTLSTLAMIAYPLLAGLLRLDHAQAGIFLGGTIHDVAQVVGAGYMISPETGSIATYVKLLRVATLIPVVLGISVMLAEGDRHRQTRPLPALPLFLAGFAALVLLNSVVPLPVALVGAATDVSSWCLVTAIAALGMKTSFEDLLVVGWRPLALMLVETAWIAVLVLLAIAFVL